MPKTKTNKSAAARVRVTPRGKVLRYRAGSGHLKSRKSPSRIRRFRKEVELTGGMARKAKRMLGM